MYSAADDPRFFEALIHGYLANPRHNSIEPGSAEPAWDTPLVGFVRGDDPVFAALRQREPDRWTPLDAFRLAFPDTDATAADLAVAAWALPQTLATRQEARKRRELPGRRWALARHFGGEINEALRRHAVEMLMGEDLQACAPALLERGNADPNDTPDATDSSVETGAPSRWSEREAAYACGLGTFGLCDALITPSGKAVRLGSIVARALWPATPRPYTGRHDWCLFYALGKCSACARRCPAGAITAAGRDKDKCRAYVRDVTAPFVSAELLGFPVDACGLCQTAVPCEKSIPAALRPGKGI